MQEKSPSIEQVREFVIASHGNLEKVKQMLAENPSLLTTGYQWNENDNETPIQAAAQVGNKPIAEYLLERGAPVDICTAAMLGRREEVQSRLDANPIQVKATGAHGIPLLPHAVWSEDQELVRLLFERGATTAPSLALHNAILKGNYDIVQWMLDNASPDINAKDYRGKTPLAVAVERKQDRIAGLLRARGATESV
jgi:uncharacterized protein